MPPGQPGAYGQPPAYSWQVEYSQPGYSSQPQYEPPPFYNPRPVTNRYNYPAPRYYQSPGYGNQPVRGFPQSGYGQSPWIPGQPRAATAPEGTTLPCTLNTAISTSVARSGNYVQALLAKNVPLTGGSYLPAGTKINGQISQATGGRYFSRSGSLSLIFNEMQLPNGTMLPMSAHTIGDLGKYIDKGGTYHGEGWGAKLGQFALRTAAGAGGGLALGTALGGIMGHGDWSSGMLWGSAMGAGLGALDTATLRKGRDVMLPAGTQMTLQLDQPIQIPLGGYGPTAGM
jgi:hypothetical protein